jgi:predicted RNA-binding protein (virulence factor B family)
MIEIGKTNELTVIRRVSIGLYLGDSEGNEVLLPAKYVPRSCSIGEPLNVFIYKDSEDRVIATTLVPKITLNHFAFLRVEMVSEVGAFLDWGLEKHLLVPFREQMRKMVEGQSYIVYMYYDEKSERLVASAKLNQFLDNEHLTVRTGDEVDVMLWEETDLGINVIINHRHKGLIYDNEIFTEIEEGETRKGFIKNIREDNKIDVLLQKSGYGNIEPSAADILEKLKAGGGFLALTDKSEPEEIISKLGMSKKTFKKAIGSLYRRKIITLEKDGIRLVVLT